MCRKNVYKIRASVESFSLKYEYGSVVKRGPEGRHSGEWLSLRRGEDGTAKRVTKTHILSVLFYMCH